MRWQEYYELVTVLLQWIRNHVVIFEERKFPTSYEEIEVRRSTVLVPSSSFFHKRGIAWFLCTLCFAEVLINLSKQL